MTDTPMTPDRERMIRIWHEELARLTDPTAVARRAALGDLLVEVDRLRAALSDAADQVAERDDELGGFHVELDHLRREIRHHQDSKARWRGRAEAAEAKVAELEARPTRAEVLGEAADHFDATLEGRYVTRYFGHQVAAELRVLAVSSQGAAETEVTQ